MRFVLEANVFGAGQPARAQLAMNVFIASDEISLCYSSPNTMDITLNV